MYFCHRLCKPALVIAKSKLCSHNYAIYDKKSNDATCYVLNETEGSYPTRFPVSPSTTEEIMRDALILTVSSSIQMVVIIKIDVFNAATHSYFTISNGVKQGGVLSPVLFSIYLDQLIVQLRLLGMGCYMNGLFTGVFIYADDITLLAPSRASMVLMLEKCYRKGSHEI